MKILMIGGLLGSGKTTILLKLAKQFKDYYKNIIIIENEIGEIGIDGKYLQNEGLQVQELYSGCICCTLSVDLVSTLEKLESLYKPELVIIELSGVAYAANVVEIIYKYLKANFNLQVITIIDAVRYFIFKEMLFPLFVSNVEVADFLVVNKVDEIEKCDLNKIIADLQSLKELGQGKIIVTSSLKDNYCNNLWRELNNGT